VECIRCGREHNGTHLYCKECRAKFRKETPEEKEHWKKIRKQVSQAHYEANLRANLRDNRTYKYGSLEAMRWSTKVQNWKKLGIVDPPETKEEYDEMIADTGGICPACRRPPKGKRAGGWMLHHNHKTGKVIGVVCTRCNLGMGQFEDNPDLLMIVAYWMVQQEGEGYETTSVHLACAA